MATVPVLESAISQTIREELLPTIYEIGSKKCPVFAMARRDWSKVVRNEGIGRLDTVKKVWGLGLAGGGTFGSSLGGQMISGIQNFSAFGQPESWPGFDEVAAPTFLTSTVSLVKHKLNMFIAREIMQADKYNASIGQVTPFYIRGLANLAVQQECGVFYSTDTTNYSLAAIGDTSATVTNVSGDTSAINVAIGGTGAVGRVMRLDKGQRVDLYNAAGTVKRNTDFNIFVDNVDYNGQVWRLKRLDGGELQTTTVLGGGVTYAGASGDNDIIVLADSKGFSPATMEAWVADGTTQTSFFGIDVRNHGDFKSIREAISAPLTEALLNRHVGYFYESFQDVELPRCVTTMGVLLGFIDNIDQLVQGATLANPGRLRYERNGKTLDVKAGWDTFEYRFGGRKIDFYTSRFAAKGRAYFGEFDLTRHVPPPVPGSKMDSRVGSELEFLGSTGGTPYDSIFVRADNNNRFTNLLQTPAERKFVVMPNTPNHLLLTTITEETGF